MMILAKWTVLFFGLFLIAVGFIMLLAPKTASQILKKAGSTNFINYAEITIRMIPAAGLVLYAPLSKYPDFFNTLGWFMIVTSVVLYFVPRQIHYRYSLRCADIIKPLYFQLISPFSMLFGTTLIYCVI